MLTFEESIHFLTEMPAELYGLREPDVLREGWYPDVVVIDPSTVGSDEPAMRFDFPARRAASTSSRPASST